MGDFNPYTVNINVDFIKEICLNKGYCVHFKRNEYFLREGQVNSFIGFVIKGIFKYTCTNHTENRNYNIGFSFQDEFIVDYPAYLYNLPSEVNIQAITSCEVYLCAVDEIRQYYAHTVETEHLACTNAELLHLQTFTRYLDMYRKTPEERYKELIERCPDILQLISLKELASYLKITPVHLSRIRRKLTFAK